MTAVEAEQFGPARYTIRYADGGQGVTRTLRRTMEVLCMYGREDGAVRVEPVAGTQYRVTYSGTRAVGFWWPVRGSLDRMLREHIGGTQFRAVKLELRSPVTS